MYLEIRENLTEKGDIIAPDIHITKYCNYLNTLLKGVFTIPARHYKEPDKYVLIGFYLLQSIFSEEDSDFKFVALQLLERIVTEDYDITLKIYELIPLAAIIFKPDTTAEQLAIIKQNYDGVSCWLDAWHKKIDTYQLKHSAINWLEKTAFTKLKRYDLIRELHSNKYLDEFLPGHNSSWLIAEMSILLSAVKSDVPNVDQMYLGCKQHIDNLDDFSKKPDHYLTNDLIGNFALYIDTVARNKAEVNKYFDTNYFRPYLAAQRSENAHTKKAKLELVSIAKPQQSKRGRKMGQKRKC